MATIDSESKENQSPIHQLHHRCVDRDDYSSSILLSSDVAAAVAKPRTMSILGLESPLALSCPLKRKRPPMIQIPQVLQEIPADKVWLRVRDCPPQHDAVLFPDLGAGVFSVKGKKKLMEDTHRVFSCSRGNPTKGFFGVYDGHGGTKAADFVAENLHINVAEMFENAAGNSGKEEAVKAGYLKTDREFLKQGLGSGACCVTALIEENEIVVSNLGDCRAVLSRNGVAEALTKDHKAERADEREMIEKKGGYVEIHRGAWRVHGVLSVSRSIGDAHLKNWVLAEPETKTLEMTPDMEFLILASDGLWDKVGNQEVVDTVIRLCSVGQKLALGGDNCKENTSPPSLKQRKVLLVKQPLKGRWSPRCMKATDAWKEGGDDFGSENQSPPSKVQRVSLDKRKGFKNQSSTHENSVCCPKKQPTSVGIAAACRELTNLSLSRGSLDDITVMIIDLNHFRNKSWPRSS